MSKLTRATDADQFEKIALLFESLRRRGWTQEAILRECMTTLAILYSKEVAR